MPLFFWKELCATFSLEEQARIRQLLEKEGIDYRVKVVNRNSPSPLGTGTRSSHGTFGENPQLAREYIFLVRRETRERADFLLRQRG